MPRHAAGIIPILPRPDVIVMETIEATEPDDGIDQLRRELEALAFSTELL